MSAWQPDAKMVLHGIGASNAVSEIRQMLWRMQSDLARVPSHRQLQQSTNATGDRNDTTTTQPPVTSDWNCLELDSGDFPFLCSNIVTMAYGMDDDGFDAPPTAQPYFFCTSDDWIYPNNVTTAVYDEEGKATASPQRPLCSDFCAIQDVTSLELCNSCKLLANGRVAYDCTNLYMDAYLGQHDKNTTTDVSDTGTTADGQPAVCASRNEFGDCATATNNVDPYQAFYCFADPFAGGGGYSCVPGATTPYYVNDRFPLQALLFCTDIPEGGLTLGLCGTHICFLQDTTAGNSCDACELLLPNGRFAYDCSNLFPSSECSRTDREGSCVELEASPTEEDSNITMEQSALKAARQPQCLLPKGTPPKTGSDTDDDDDSQGWILHNLDATSFNFLSDIVALCVRILFGLTISYSYTAIMSWQLSAGHCIPVSMLGVIPGDVVAAGHLAQAVRFTLPALLLASLLLIADFSHSMADLGFTVVTVEEEGPLQPVLSLITEHRNPKLPLEMAGDPVSARTVVYADAGDEFGMDNGRDAEVLNFITAAAQIGRGTSPFVTGVEDDFLYFSNATFGGLDGLRAVVGVCENDSLLEIPHEIPVDCANSTMLSFDQISPGSSPFDSKLRHEALVPVCTLTSKRDSGIYHSGREDTLGAARIMERMNIVGIGTLGVYNVPVYVIHRNTTVKVFDLLPEEKKLARDRPNWTQGRRVPSIEGVQIGNETVLFATAVLASGPEDNVLPSGNVISNNDGEEYIRRNVYHVFAEMQGPCPSRPSGRSTDGLVCMADVVLNCDTFPEDYQFTAHDVFYPTSPTTCELSRVFLIWGDGFVADAEMVAVTAGLYGIVRPQFFDTAESTFILHGILGAVFSLSSLVERPSIDAKVRPKVNGVYLAFMLLPVFVMAVGLLVAWSARKRRIPVPRKAWDLLILGQESGDKIQRRRSKLDKYGKPDPGLVLRLKRTQIDEGNSVQREVVLVRENISRSRKSQMDEALAKNAGLETPVPNDEASEKGETRISDLESPSNPGPHRQVTAGSQSSAGGAEESA